MTLWNKEKVDGVADDNDNKPNWLSADEKARCYCDDRGWVLVHLNGTEEVLVSGAGLNEPNDSTNGQDVGEKTAAVAQKDLQMSKRPMGDFDDDGIKNFEDPDIDEDGTPNETDPDPYDDQVS